MSTNFQTTPVPPVLVADLYEAYQALMSACASVRVSLKDDGVQGLPVYVPTHGKSERDHQSLEARKAASDSITQIDGLGDQPFTAGIVCASPSTVDSVSTLNNCKERFKECVMAIKACYAQSAPASRIAKLIQNEITEKGYRSEALKSAMGISGTTGLDLKRCYAHIRIMPSRLEMFSWTWTMKHARIIRLTVAEALEMVDNLPAPDAPAANVARSLLASLPAHEHIARKVPLPNQLRANYAYVVDGETIRKSCPISGVVLAQQAQLPRYLWRENPGDGTDSKPRLARISGIEPEPFIKILGLHRYVR